MSHQLLFGLGLGTREAGSGIWMVGLIDITPTRRSQSKVGLPFTPDSGAGPTKKLQEKIIKASSYPEEKAELTLRKSRVEIETEMEIKEFAVQIECDRLVPM